MLQNIRQLLAKVKSDPAINQDLPALKKLARKTFAWLLVSELVLVARFYPIKYFIDELTRDDIRFSRLLIITAIMALLFRLSGNLHRRTDSWRHNAMTKFFAVCWSYGHRVELRLSSDWHKAHGTGEKESMVGKNIYRFQVLIDVLVFDTIPATLRISFTTIFLLFINWQLGLVALLTNVVFGITLRYNERLAVEPRKERQAEFKRLERFGTEMTNNWRTIKAMGREEDFSDINHDMLEGHVANAKQRIKIFMKIDERQLSVLAYTRGAFYLVIALQTLQSSPDIGAIVLSIALMDRAFSNYFRFSDLQRVMNEGQVALHELIQLMNEKPSVSQAASPQWPSCLRGGIVFDDVGFAYPDEPDIYKIRHFSLKVEPHTTTAFVGPSGAGKSTIMSLILRESDPTDGRVLIDGVNLPKLDYKRYRAEAIAVVSQHIELFDTTIMENIRFSRPSATDEEVIEAAKAANAHEFIMELKNGYGTQIGEDGVRLSGGQRQRLAIARALARKPAILILDEATSALDAQSQAEVQKTLNKLIAARELTIFIVAHRLSTTMHADQIVVMKNGSIDDVGSHKDLLKRDGLYANLVTMEADGLLG